MIHELLIMRHAKSAWDTSAKTDFDRPLAKRGYEAAPKMGRWLKAQGLMPDYVLSSPAKRAQETIEQVCAVLDIAPATIQWRREIYEATASTLLQLLVQTPASAQRVLLVGHNPGEEDLLLHLCGPLPIPDDRKLLPTAAIAQLSLSCAWQDLAANCARCVQLQRPRELPDRL